MLLKTFEIENLRAFGSKQVVDFAQPSEGKSGSGLTVIVGPNNSGKSTILRSIRNLITSDPVFVAGIDDRRSKALVGLRLVGTDDAAAPFDVSIEQRADTAHLNKLGLPSGRAVKLTYIPSRRPWQDKFVAQGNFTAENYEINYFQQLRQNEFYVDQQFGNAIFQIHTDAEKRERYTQILIELEPSITEWRTDNNGQDYIAFKSISGDYHRTGLVGEGVNNLFRIAYSLFEFKSGDVLLLDEPELSLHPQAQKRLHAALRSRSQRGQIVVSTHSPYFVSWSDIQAGAKIYRTSLVENDGATIRTIEPKTIKRITAVAQEKKNRKLYDVVAKEIFFSRGCLFVEGQEDAHIIAIYIEENAKTNIEIFGYGSGGASHMGSWLSLANELGIKAAALFDNDEAGQCAYAEAVTQFKTNPKILLLILPTADIRDKPDKNKEGIFDEAWKLKPAFETAWNTLLDKATAFLK